MDGLSAAASGIAVVSLVMQLVDSVREIRRFLRSVSDAPKELKRLVDLLEQLELTFQQIVMLVQKQENARLGKTDVFTNVLRAIKTCETKLTMFENLVEATKQASSTTNRAARTIGSLKLAYKKRDIQEFESQLHGAITFLTLTVIANLTYAHSESTEQLLSQVSATNQAASAITQELAHIRTSLASGHRDNCSETCDVVKHYPQRRGQSRKLMDLSKQSTFKAYTTPLGKVFVRKISRSASLSNEVVQSSSWTYSIIESSWVFMPSFLSRCVDFRYLSTYGNVQRSLRIYPVIQMNHPVWKMCEKGDLEGIQKLLSERQVSPFSVNSSGETLLHRAAGYYMSTVCEFLFEAGLTGEEVDNSGRPSHSPRSQLIVRSEPMLQSFKRTYHLFTSRIDDLDPALFGYGPFCHWKSCELSAHLFNEMVNDFVSKENISNSMDSPIGTAMRMLWKSHPTDRDHDSWKQVTRRLISLVADPLNYSRRRGIDQGYTLLGEILNLVDRPFESISIGRVFLDILSDLKLDVVAYLQAESKRHFDPSKSLPMLRKNWNTEFRKRYLVISKAPSSVSWEWFMDPKGSAFEVLDELKNFALGCSYHYAAENDHWPFFYSDYYKLTNNFYHGRTVSPKDSSALRIWKDRFQRRQHKKGVKLAKSQGIPHQGLKVPGAWVD